jgi:hypothetical protein
MRFRTAALCIALVAIALVMAACSSSSVNTSGGKTTSRGAVAVTSYRLSCDEVACYVKGSAKVNSDCTYAQVEFRLLSSSGALVGTAFANASNLRKGDAWEFSAIGFSSGSKVTRAELAGVTSF